MCIRDRVIIELMTGTFYLLVIGIGALVGALAAWLAVPFLGQVALAGTVASVGAWWAHKWHGTRRVDGDQANALDVGQSVTVTRWINPAEGMLRVRYRGVEWDARVNPQDVDAVAVGEGGMLHILAQDGQCWVVGVHKLAP